MDNEINVFGYWRVFLTLDVQRHIVILLISGGAGFNSSAIVRFFMGSSACKIINVEKYCATRSTGVTIFDYRVNDPECFSLTESTLRKRTLNVEEKPVYLHSNYSVNGLHFYDNDMVDIAEQVTPPAHGRQGVISINQVHLKRGDLNIDLLGFSFFWLDTSTHESLVKAAQFFGTIDNRQRYKKRFLVRNSALLKFFKSMLASLTKKFVLNE